MQDWGMDLAGLQVKKTLAAWQILGVRKITGEDLPQVNIKGSVILPAGHDGPAFLVYNNFHTILKWNRSDLYAIAVGHLADRIIGKAPFQTKRPTSEQRLSRNQVEKIQEFLIGFGVTDTPGRQGVSTHRKTSG